MTSGDGSMLDQLLAFTVPAAYALLPSPMRSTPATALLVAIGLQESRLRTRQQLDGPALGFWQFELGGIAAVMQHPQSRDVLTPILTTLCYLPIASACHAAVQHNDTLAYCFARLLLWTLPDALPTMEQADIGWSQYLARWRPSAPRRNTWSANYREAWLRVAGPAPQTGEGAA